MTYTGPIFYPESRVNSVPGPALSLSLPRLVALIVPQLADALITRSERYLGRSLEIFVTKRDGHLHES